jgi:hypothetical protein
MFRTIQLSSRVSVQGRFVKDLENGEVEINDGVRTWRGRPIESARSLKGIKNSIARALKAPEGLGGTA